MADILAIDLAWEAVTVLGEVSRTALAELERLSGKVPLRPTQDAASVRVALRKHASDSIASIISRAASARSPELTATESEAHNIKALIRAYRDDPNSAYQKVQESAKRAARNAGWEHQSLKRRS